MGSKNIIISAALLAVLVGIYFAIDHMQNPYTEVEKQDTVAQIKDKLKPNAVASVILSGKGNKDGSYGDDPAKLVDGKVVINKQGDGWVLPDLYGYPGARSGDRYAFSGPDLDVYCRSHTFANGSAARRRVRGRGGTLGWRLCRAVVAQHLARDVWL